MAETAHQRSGNFASPAGYNQYVAIQHRLGKKPLPLLAKFDARYRFAGQLHSIEILGLSADATDAYLSALRLALAYSALETLTDAAFLKGKLHVKDATLATSFRSARLSKFRAFLIENTSANVLRGQLERLVAHPKDSDMLPVIAATRHLMFHGMLNPNSAGLTSKTARTFIESLGQATFREMDARMLAYLDEYKATLTSGS
jgi:hypothetical protein